MWCDDGRVSDHVIDLRSDTVTRPTPAMRAAMAAAEVGDDVYGEDPTANALEERVAAMLGHQAGVFTATGSLANQLGLRLLVGPGQELVTDDAAHVVRAELGAAAVFSGITTRTYAADRGLLDLELVRCTIRPASGPYLVSTTTVAVENTHNFGGGTVQPLDRLLALRALADEHGLSLHLDGARLWNAHVASGVALAAYGSLFDTVSVCFSKGLGAPVGSLLVSSAERIAEARVWRKRYGGGMRQIGVLAAACAHALDQHLDRLAEDHTHAQVIATACAAASASVRSSASNAAPTPGQRPPGNGVVDPAQVETNIVPLQLDATAWPSAADFVTAARGQGVLVSALGPRFVRVVTHLDVDDADAKQAADVLAGLLAHGPA
ncbi:MAG: GntG family PLP-dependent aldolase [Candidatus Nanopelagicales bacterium]